MYKLGFKGVEEPEIKLPPFVGSWKAREFHKNISFCFSDYTKVFDCVDHNKLWKILKEIGIKDHLIWMTTIILTVVRLKSMGFQRVGHHWVTDGRQSLSFWCSSSLMFKLVLEKAEEPEIKLPTSTGSWKKQESSRKTSISALLTMPKPLTVWITINCGKFWKRWEYQTTWPASW